MDKGKVNYCRRGEGMTNQIYKDLRYNTYEVFTNEGKFLGDFKSIEDALKVKL